ncbi:RNA polymerase sigma factor [bacterium]|nr:RNA polymerase sigma factor [bacterium]
MNTQEIKNLIEKAKDKDSQAFGELFDFYYPKILNYTLRSTTNLDNAKDITSNTFLKALQGLEKFEWQTDSSFNAWIYKIATNEINQFFRKNKKYQSIIKIEEKDLDLSDNNLHSKTIQAAIENDEYLKVINRSLIKMNRTYQDIIRLRYIEDLSYEEVSRIIGKNESTTRVYCMRAKDKLKELIEKDNKKFLEN